MQIPHSSSNLFLIWNNLINRYHCLGSGPLCGARFQIRYRIKSKYGWVGALSFSAAFGVLKDRDNFIAWSVAARIKNLQYIVYNSSFFIIPSVNIANLVLSGQISYNGNIKEIKVLMYENQMRLFNLKGEINE
jgi:hypothetical protein